MTGSGNDFVFVDGRSTPLAFWTPDRIRAVCARQTGVGSDGLCIVEPGVTPGGVRLHYFNRDGRRAELCGNASLCAARLASWIELGSEEGVILETDAGLIPARALPDSGERAEILIGDVSGIVPAAVELVSGENSAHFVRVGVPHLVVQVENLPEVDVSQRGRTLRFHPSLSDGANVNFVGWNADGWAIRTYERGVEAETLACGTGSVATATVLAMTQGIALPVAMHTSSGRVLEISGHSAGPGAFKEIRLRGEGKLVFRAVLGG
jgi:diaminopimelate epimerase